MGPILFFSFFFFFFFFFFGGGGGSGHTFFSLSGGGGVLMRSTLARALKLFILLSQYHEMLQVTQDKIFRQAKKNNGLARIFARILPEICPNFAQILLEFS